jgi:hypothetical protein
MTEWRCKKDGVLLAIVENNEISIRYKDLLVAIKKPAEIKTECRRCGTKNVLKVNELGITQN